jgi:hypothetical protein
VEEEVQEKSVVQKRLLHDILPQPAAAAGHPFAAAAHVQAGVVDAAHCSREECGTADMLRTPLL